MSMKPGELPRVNDQLAEKPVVDPMYCIDVVDVFPTIQGEGPHVGRPATFIRTAGCNLTCPACDTNYTANRRKYSVNSLVDVVKSYGKELVVITGGEPFRQDISSLINTLGNAGFDVQVETNGTLWGVRNHNIVPGRFLSIVCSPKTPILNDKIKPYVDALKYVIDAGNVSDFDGLPVTTLGNVCGVARPWLGFQGRIYVQPLDVGDPVRNKANIQATLNSCDRFGYTLSFQIHKLIGLP